MDTRGLEMHGLKWGRIVWVSGRLVWGFGQIAEVQELGLWGTTVVEFTQEELRSS